jgi:hypothetical protein
MAKVHVADSGAVAIVVEMEDEEGKKSRTQEWIQSGEKKNFSTTYVDSNGNTCNLQGMSKVKNLNFLLTGVFGIPSAETKQIKEYDWENKQDVMVEREVILDWINKPIGICVQMTEEDKYNDETNSVTRPLIEHFFDPVTDQFGSEKIGAKPAELKAKFLEFIEKTPVKDKRKKSKGSSTAPQNTQTGQSTPNGTNVGF